MPPPSEDFENRFWRAVSELKAEVHSVGAVAASAMAAISSHTAVCDERQRQLEARARERAGADQERIEDWNNFKKESREDRKGIREAVELSRAQTRTYAISILSTVALLLITLLVNLTASHFLGK